MSIYQETLSFLHTHFDPATPSDTLTQNHTDELKQRLSAVDPELVFGSETKEEIRRAFTDFYSASARISLFFKGDAQIILKLLPPAPIAADEVVVKKLVERLGALRDELMGGSQEYPDIISVPQKEVAALQQIVELHAPLADSRELIRKGVIRAFELESRDMVFFLNGKVVIRLFQRTRIERRFEGLPDEDVRQIVDDLYSGAHDEDMAADLDMVMSTLTDSKLNFKEIDNFFFNSEHIKLIQEALVRFYKPKLAQDEIVVRAVANYILRDSFYYIHEQLAEKLLELIERKDKNAEAFLRYYNGSTHIQNGQKHVTPEIIDEEGHTWNTVTIVNFISQFSKNRTTITKKENHIRRFQSEEAELKASIAQCSGLVEKASQKTLPPELQEGLLRQLEINQRTLNKNSAKNEDQTYNGLSADEIREAFLKSVRDMEKRIDFLHMRIESDTKVIEEIEGKFAEQQQKYDMLLIAISEVLMDRKTPATATEKES